MLVSVVAKKTILNLRLRPEVRDDFATAAELRGASMSGLLHQFIVRVIREEKDIAPQEFKENGIGAVKVTGVRYGGKIKVARDDQQQKRKTG